MSDPTPRVHVVDDDPVVRSALRLLLETDGHRVEEYVSANDFLARCTAQCSGCLLTDIHMPGLSGLELQDALTERGIDLPVIVLTGRGDVPAAVKSLKAGALDFIEKPFDPQALLEQIRRALAVDDARREARARQAQRERQLASLTPREREVGRWVAGGASNKLVALELGISERTVELHRGRVMKKLGVRSVAELALLFAAVSQAQC